MQALPEFAAAGVVLIVAAAPMLAAEASANATNMILSFIYRLPVPFSRERVRW
jgi:hypothetical protein